MNCIKNCLLVIAALAPAMSISDLADDDWIRFKEDHRKIYTSDVEDRCRMEIFKENRRKIAVHNRNYDMGLATFTMGINYFSDLLPHEFAKYKGFKKSSKSMLLGSTFTAPSNVTLPSEIDWRKKGAVTPIKSQGRCGACWAFSATGALEGQHFLKTGKLISLSEQNLVDCTMSLGNLGCSGGQMDVAFHYVKANKGIDTETSYPYEAEEGVCRYDGKNSGATDSGFSIIPEGSEEQLKAAVATVGPISVSIATPASFLLYKGGVHYNSNCSAYESDHAVLVIGYGTTKEGEDYWLIKNSWGSSQWGEKGYGMMSRNKKNNCGIATRAVYPLV